MRSTASQPCWEGDLAMGKVRQAMVELCSARFCGSIPKIQITGPAARRNGCKQETLYPPREPRKPNSLNAGREHGKWHPEPSESFLRLQDLRWRYVGSRPCPRLLVGPG